MTRKIPPQHRKKYRPKHRVDGTFKKSKRHKYNAKGRYIDDMWFASKAEGDRYEQLKEMVSRHMIYDLECQVKYPLPVKSKIVANYIADFRYKYKPEGKPTVIVIEDVKGMVTPEYRLKKKMFEVIYYPFVITEIPGASVPKCRFLPGDQAIGSWKERSNG